MFQQFCPRLSEAFGSKIFSLDKLFPTPKNSKSQNFEDGAFHAHISCLSIRRKIAKNLNYSSENRGGGGGGEVYLKSPRMTFIEPNMDEGCRIVHRFNENPSHDFFRLTAALSAVNFS